MTASFASIRHWIAAEIEEYLSTETHRRDAISAGSSLLSFVILLYLASHGFMPAYLLIDTPGRVMAVKFMPSPDVTVADVADSRIRNVAPTPRMTSASARPRTAPPLESLSSMAATRPDYFGRTPILPAARPDRPVRSDLPERWQDLPVQAEAPSERPTHTAAQVALPSAKVGKESDRGGGGDADAESDVTFDVPVRGNSRGSDFITLSGRTAPSSVGQPGGREITVRRPIIHSPLPPLPEWFERKGLNTFVTFRIIVSASGRVESAEVEKTSGSPQLDADYRAAVLQWRLAPTGFREALTVKLKLKLR